jgi:hypothetical protein
MAAIAFIVAQAEGEAFSSYPRARGEANNSGRLFTPG